MTPVFMIVSFALAFVLLGAGLRFVDGLEAENRLAESQLAAERMYDGALSDRVREVQRFRHDVNGLLQAIEFAQREDGARPDDERADGTRPDDERLGNARPNGEHTQDTLPLVDALIDMKRGQCAEAGITFSCENEGGFASAAARCGLTEQDASLVVQNLLENAYEASLAVEPASARTIAIRLAALQPQGVSVEVRNRTAHASMPTFRTDKEDAEQHGIGLRVVDEIARKHGGAREVAFDEAERMLTTRVTCTGLGKPDESDNG